MKQEVIDGLVNALKVIAFDEKICEFLEANDPKAMEQVVDAVEQVELSESEVAETESLGNSLGAAFEQVIKDAQESQDDGPSNLMDLTPLCDENRRLEGELSSVTRSMENREKLLRKFALLVLDDQHGINNPSYKILVDLLMKSHDDIMGETELVGDRVFINEDFAEEELKKL